MSYWKHFNVDANELKDHFKVHKAVKEFQAHSSKVHSVGWSCDGKRLASCSFDKSVATFTLDKDRLNKEYTYKGHNGSVDQLCWHKSNPDLLSTASGDKTVKVWDVRHQKCSNTILTKGENINITWSPDGHTIAVGNKEDLITFIDMRTLKSISEQQFNFEVNEMSWNNESDLFFLTNGLGCVYVLSFPDLVQRHVVKAHPGTCICIEFAPSGKYFAVGSADASVSLWDLENLACVQTYNRLDWPVRALSFSYDGKMLASGSEDLYVDIADVTNGEKITDIPIDAATFTVAWHPKQYLLAFACDDKEQFDRKRDTGNLKVFGFSSE